MSKTVQPATMADCTKCRIRHARPVGVRCRRNLNVSAPVPDSDQSSVHIDFQSQPGTSQPGNNSPVRCQSASLSGRAEAGATQADKDIMDSKLDLILRKMEKNWKKRTVSWKRNSTSNLLSNQLLGSRTVPPKGHTSAPPHAHPANIKGVSCTRRRTQRH